MKPSKVLISRSLLQQMRKKLEKMKKQKEAKQDPIAEDPTAEDPTTEDGSQQNEEANAINDHLESEEEEVLNEILAKADSEQQQRWLETLKKKKMVQEDQPIRPKIPRTDSILGRITNPYENRNSSHDPSAWFNHYEELANSYFWTDIQKALYFSLNLSDEALDWFRSLSEKPDWNQIKPMFIEKFKVKTVALTEFLNVEFKFVTGFKTFLESKKKLAMSAGLKEEDACIMIVNALPANIQNQLNNPIPTAYESLLHTGMLAEKTAKDLHHASKQFRRPRFQQPFVQQFSKPQRPAFQPRFQGKQAFNRKRDFKAKKQVWCQHCYKNKGKKLPHRSDDCYNKDGSQNNNKTKYIRNLVIENQNKDQDNNKQNEHPNFQ